MARHPLIDHHLAVLAEALPQRVVDELADGLLTTWEHLVDSGISPDEAAQAALADFGDAHRTVAALVSQAPGRRIARLLLFTAPPLAACWAATLLAARAWTWPVPPALAVILGAVLSAAVTTLVLSVTSRRSYLRARLGIVGGVGVLLLDTGMLAIVATAAPAFVWPMAAAIPASLSRMALTVRAFRLS